MRYNIQGIARDSYGKILPQENVNVYESGTSIPAIVYDSKTSSVQKSSVTTAADGRFIIYFDSVDYEGNFSQTFDIDLDGNSLTDIDIFEIQKRAILWNPTTELEDGTVLGYDGDPNYVNSGGTNGERWLYDLPVGRLYRQNDATLWWKTEMPNTWIKLGESGEFTGGIDGGSY